MKRRFWLLDIQAERVGGRPELRLWGVTDDGKRILVLDGAFLPSFYLVAAPDADAAAIRDGVEKLAARSRSTIAHAEVVARRRLGRPVLAVKVSVTVVDPAAVARVAKRTGELPGVGEVLEDDLRAWAQYVMDRGIVPCGWHEVEGEPVPPPDGTRVDEAFRAVAPPVALDLPALPPLRTLAFAAIARGPFRARPPERRPLAAIAAVDDEGATRVWLADGDDDAAALAGFAAHVRERDPDLLLGWESNLDQWTYLAGRARAGAARMVVDRVGGEPHPSAYRHVSIAGRAHVDVADLAAGFGDVKVKTLDNVARWLGYPVADERVEDVAIAGAWADPARRPVLGDQAARDAALVLAIGRSMLPELVQLAQLVRLPADQVARATPGFRAEQVLLAAARARGELAPKRAERPWEPYVGGLVSPPTPGLHRDVAVLDFRSLYPNVMMRFNVSPDTWVQPGEAVADDAVHRSPALGHRFRRAPAGLYTGVLHDLMAARRGVRERMANAASGSAERRLLDARQKVLKVLANACYGYAGWLGARWYLRPVAEAVTDWGRATITRALAIAAELGLDVLYSDTDSLFARYDAARVARFIGRVGAELGLEVALERLYDRVLFTEAKKRYAGLTSDGEVEIVGLEVVRGDWAQVARDLQRDVVRQLLEERPREEILDTVRRRVADVAARRVPLRDLVIWKAVTRPFWSYEQNAAHVAAARQLADAGWPPRIGDPVGYVVVAGKGPLYQRAVPWQQATLGAVDVDYYVTHQLLPAVRRVLGDDASLVLDRALSALVDGGARGGRSPPSN